MTVALLGGLMPNALSSTAEGWEQGLVRAIFMIIHIYAHHVLANRLNAIKLRNFIGIQTIRL